MVQSVSRSRGCCQCLRRKIKASNSFQGSNDITPERAPSCLPAKTSPQHMFEQALWSNFIESFSQSGSKLTQPDSWTRYLLSWISSLKDPWVVDSSNDACLVRTGI
ncbi:unnamed protein product [Penicillium camemberti]|uniref:Str. FM013 n=1 Tax=Penicillium camemberti (strain FM 013) TaxID=1429867 RepID=A0A0G4PS07_PENC3|nr:unnamed protein product [Penicillium camemberti]